MKKSLTLAICLFSLSATAQMNTSSVSLENIRLDKIKKYIQPDLFYTHDYLSNTGGEKSGPRNVGALDLYLDSDLSRYSSIRGDLRIHYTHISAPDSRGVPGDTQATSNIEAPGQIDRLTDLYYQHHFSNTQALLIGIHDISTEFNITDSSLNFLNGSFGTGTEFAMAGPNGPSIYPLSAVGIRHLGQFNENWSLRSGLYDANPGDESTYRSLHSDIGSQDGFLLISELNFKNEAGKWVLGGWGITKNQDFVADEEEESPRQGAAYGAYSLYEQSLGHSSAAFIRYGFANEKVTSVKSNTALGFIHKGILQRKNNQDEIGLGLTQVDFSQDLLSETAYELYYQFEPMRSIILRPDLQFVHHPSGSDEIKDAWVMGLRTVVNI